MALLRSTCRAHRTRRALLSISCVLLLLCFAISGAPQLATKESTILTGREVRSFNGREATPVQASAMNSISSVLNPDGSMKRGVSGRFDSKGYQLTNGPTGEPLFAPENKATEIAPSGSCNDGWHDGPPVNGVDRASAIAVDGAGNVYVGGAEVAGSTFVNGIAKWDGSSWSALGSGTNGYVSGVAVSGTDVYVVGSFTTAGGVAANNIAKWNGSNWSPVGSGLNFGVADIEIAGGDIYVGGGSYDPSDGTPTGYVSKWNGSTWTELGSGFDWNVTDIAVSGSDVYAAGVNDPETGDSTDPNLIAKWDGSSWSPLGAGPNGVVYAIAVSGTDVYASISRFVGGNGVGFVTKWNGSVWSELGSGMPGHVNAIAVSGTDVYVAGRKWNGASWSALGNWVGYVDAIAISGADVYFGGAVFSSAGDVRRADGIAKWNGSSWSALGAGLYSIPYAFAQSGTDVYAGGYFTTDGGSTYSRVAIWNGTSWTPLGSWSGEPAGTSRYVYDIAVSGNDVYIGGAVATGGIRTGYVARWNGSTWVALGSGMTGAGNSADVTSLAISGNDVYAGGGFTTAGGVAANNIAKWNGSSWSPVGPGLSGGAHLAVFETDVYAGTFHQFAKWNGTNWTNLPLPPHYPSFGYTPQDFCCYFADLEASGTDLYVADGFSNGYGEGRGYVSKWNGSNWTELGEMCCESIYDIAVSGTIVYAVGGFDTASGTPAHRIARWNGSTWSPLGSGVGGTAVATSGNDVFVGNVHATAGCHVSAGFARYTEPAAEVSISGRVTTANGRGIGNAVVSMTDSVGVRRTATTSTFGYYSFTNIPGDTYNIAIRSKRYEFQPRTVFVNENLSGIDFVALK